MEQNLMNRTHPHHPAAMTDAEARKIFDQAALAEPDPDRRANIELCREYFTNPTFRKWLAHQTARIAGVTE